MKIITSVSTLSFSPWLANSEWTYWPFLNPKLFHWTRRMQFWQLCWKLLVQIPKIFRSKDEKVLKFKKFYSQKSSQINIILSFDFTKSWTSLFSIITWFNYFISVSVNGRSCLTWGGFFKKINVFLWVRIVTDRKGKKLKKHTDLASKIHDNSKLPTWRFPSRVQMRALYVRRGIQRKKIDFIPFVRSANLHNCYLFRHISIFKFKCLND